ncbi:MAG: YdcF family protein [Defluviitaleaceae bacterium]|nr:YdcF family protein [Defluviitaleaceae bacterium]
MKVNVIRVLLVLVGLISLANLLLVLNVSNPTIGFALQAVVSVLIIAYGAFFKLIPKRVHVAAVVLCTFPVALVVFLFMYGNTGNVTYSEDVVIVLGAGVRGESVTRPLARRLDTAFYYWQRNQDAYIIVTGGLGSRATITEAEAMARYLERRGMPRSRILLEEYSTSTYENLKFAQQILNEHFQGGFEAVLVTNDFHIFRAVQTARSLGLSVNRRGAYTDWYSWPVNYLREMLAVVNFLVFG